MPSLDEARALIRDVPDFPQPGILFKDITPVLGDAKALQAVLGALEERLRGRGFDRILAIESGPDDEAPRLDGQDTGADSTVSWPSSRGASSSGPLSRIA